MVDTAIKWYVEALTFYTAAISLFFVALYHFGSHGEWRHDPMGRHVMAFVAVIATTFTFLSLATIWTPLATYRWYQITYLVVGVSGIPWVVTWRVLIYARMLRTRPEGEEL